MTAANRKSAIPAEQPALCRKLVAGNPGIERKSGIHPYRSANGRMFTYLDQTARMGIRLPNDELDTFLTKYETTLFRPCGVVKEDRATAPHTLPAKTAEL